MKLYILIKNGYWAVGIDYWSSQIWSKYESDSKECIEAWITYTNKK